MPYVDDAYTLSYISNVICYFNEWTSPHAKNLKN